MYVNVVMNTKKRTSNKCVSRYAYACLYNFFFAFFFSFSSNRFEIVQPLRKYCFKISACSFSLSPHCVAHSHLIWTQFDCENSEFSQFGVNDICCNLYYEKIGYDLNRRDLVNFVEIEAETHTHTHCLVT